LILVAEAPEKPGNIGALLRTADAAHLDAVIIANPKSDLYNPNIVRSSVGCLFTNQIASGTTAEISFSKERKSISTVPHCKFNSVSYAGLHHAISCGYGSNWLDQEWRDAATQNIIIDAG
jgi:TrmH family RNA methyltransferase